MSAKYQFIQQLPGNTKNLKRAFISMVLFVVLCGVAYVVSNIFWDQYTYQAYSIKYGTNVTKGWPAFLQGWSLWLGIGFIVFLPFLFFMQDFKNPALGIMNDSLFINQQMMRNTIIPFSNIGGVSKEASGYRIQFKDSTQVVKQQIFLFKPFVSSNLKSGNFVISNTHTAGNLDDFFVELNAKLAK